MDIRPFRGTEEPSADSYMGYFLQALKEVATNKYVLLLAILATVFGTAVPGLFQDGYPLSEFADAAKGLLDGHPYALLATIAACMMLSVTIDGALTLALSGRTMWDAIRDAATVFISLFAAWGLFVASAAASLLILLIPSALVSGDADSSLFGSLFISGLLISLPIVVILAFTREFSINYILLSRTSLTESIRLGYALFKKRVKRCLFFGLALLLFVLSMSLIVEAVAGVEKLLIRSAKPLSAAGTSLILILLQSYAVAAGKSARLAFYLDINTDRNGQETSEASQKEEKVIQKEVQEVG